MELTSTKKCITRDKFLPSEDRLIIDLVQKYKTNWEIISKQFGNSRTKRQIRERWQNYLNPEFTPLFTDQEDEKLMSTVNIYGQKWSKIAGFIGNKSAVQCRNRHRVLLKMKEKGVQNIHDTNLPDCISEPPTPTKGENSIDAFDEFELVFSNFEDNELMPQNNDFTFGLDEFQFDNIF